MKYIHKSVISLIMIFLLGMIIPAKTEAAATSTLRIINAEYPTTLQTGEEFTVGGTIQSDYTITQVGFAIRSLDQSQLYDKIVVNNPGNPYTISSEVSDALEFDQLEAGSYRYMIYAKDASGASEYIFNEIFEIEEATNQSSASSSSTLRITSATYPTTLEEGESFSLSGTISSNYSLTQVAAAIRSTDLSILYDKVVVNNPSNPYSISTTINNGIEFENLSAGTYRYILCAKDSSGTVKNVVDRTFEVTARQTTATTSTLRITSATYPTTLEEGDSFTLSGTVSSNYSLTQVAAAIRSTDLSILYDKVVVNNPSNPYSISTTINNGMEFENLSAGTYRYILCAKDSSGTTKNVVDITFEVTAKQAAASTLRVVGATYPGTLKVGESFTLEGTVKCNYAITQIGFAIRSTDQTILYDKYVINSPHNPYVISTDVNNALEFENLAAGNYRYMIYAKDASGTSKYILNETFSVTTSGQTITSGDSTLRIVSATYPVTLEEGDSFTLSGTVMSNYSLTQVAAAIRSEDLTILYDKVVVNNPSNPYIIGTVIDNAMEFNRLEYGTYRYILTAKDASGAVKNLVDQTFEVTRGASTLAITNPVYPVSVAEGTDFEFGGTITSNYNVVSLAFTIINRTTDVTVRQKNIFQNATSYTIGSEVSEAMNIEDLPIGSYKYVAAARDESGNRLTLVNQNFSVVESNEGAQYAIWPLSQVYITQGAYDTYSHQTENAFDCVIHPITGARAFAPFDGRVVAAESTWGTIWFQSDEPVRYADGTYDYMTVIFMHGQNATSLLGRSFSQGTSFYILGGTGPSGPNTYDTHLHVEVYRGRVSTSGTTISSSLAWSYRGNVVPNRALYVDSSMTSMISTYGYSFQSIS